MKGTTRVGMAAALSAAALTLVLSPASAAPATEGDAPTSGFGSTDEPMTPDHASGGLLHPIFRFFNPCEYFGPRSFDKLTHLYARLDANPVFPTLTRTGKTRLASLQCGRMTVEPFGGKGLIATCKARGHLVKESWGFHHGPGPIVVPVRHLMSREDNDWQTDLAFYNIGWVRADITVWWLCNG